MDFQFQVNKNTDGPSIFVAIPNMNEIKTSLVVRLLHWFSALEYNLYFYAPINQRPHDRARNICHRHFLENTSYDYIWWIDSDVVPPYDALEKLLSYDKDIVSLTVPMLPEGNAGAALEPQAWNYDGEAFYTHFGRGLEQVDVTAIGCTLIKRKVMEDVGKGAFKFSEWEKGDGWNIEQIGEDIYFGLRYMKAGYKAWNDFTTVCDHYNQEVNVKSVQYLLGKMMEGEYK